MLKLANYSVSPVLENINVEFDVGRTYIVMGANGVGKSTLLHSIMGRPDLEVSGSIQFNNEDILELEVDERARLGMFVGFQHPTSIPGLSNFQFIKQALNTKGSDIKQTLENFKGISHSLGLPEGWDKRNLNTDASGGEKKKNELIQMNMLKTQLAMLDEPDSGLDVDAMKQVSNGVNSLRSDNRSFLIITHYQRLLNYIKPDFVHIMAKGKIIKTAGPELAIEVEEQGYTHLLT